MYPVAACRAQARPTAAPAGPNLLSGLLAYWGFDNAVTDSSGNARDLDTGTPTFSSSGFFKKLGAAALSSNSTAVSRTWGGALTLGNSDLTLAAWVSRNGGATSDLGRCGWEGVFEVGFAVSAGDSADVRTVAAIDGAAVFTGAAMTLANRTPRLMILTWVAATGAWEFWVSGTKVGSGTAASSSALSGTFTSKTAASAATVGALDDTGCWSRKLSDDEIALLFNGGAGANPTA